MHDITGMVAKAGPRLMHHLAAVTHAFRRILRRMRASAAYPAQRSNRLSTAGVLESRGRPYLWRLRRAISNCLRDPFFPLPCASRPTQPKFLIPNTCRAQKRPRLEVIGQIGQNGETTLSRSGSRTPKDVGREKSNLPVRVELCRGPPWGQNNWLDTSRASPRLEDQH